MRRVLALGFLLAATVLHAEKPGPVIVAGSARFTVIAPTCIRLEFAPDGKFVDAPSMFAVGRDAAFRDFKLDRTTNALTIDTGIIQLRYQPDGKPFNANNLQAQIAKGKECVPWHPGLINHQNLGGTIRTLDRVKGPVDLGEGLLSPDGWYLLDDSHSHLLVDDWAMERPHNGNTDWYLFGYGRDYKAALKTLTLIGGPVPMPRKYVLGSWYSRYWPYSSADFRQIVQQYKEHDFPLDVMVMDMDWHRAGWTGWSWNRKLLPDAEDLLRWFHEQGLRVTLNVHPSEGVCPHEDVYDAFMRAMGQDPASQKTIPYDAGDQNYLDTLFQYTHAPLEREGVDFWWLDWQQEPFTRSLPHLTNLAWLNHYYYQWTRTKRIARPILQSMGRLGRPSPPDPFLRRRRHRLEDAGVRGAVHFHRRKRRLLLLVARHRRPHGRSQRGKLRRAGRNSARCRRRCARIPRASPTWTAGPGRTARRRRIRCGSPSICARNCFRTFTPASGKAAAESIPLTRPMYIEYPDTGRSLPEPAAILLRRQSAGRPDHIAGRRPRQDRAAERSGFLRANGTTGSAAGMFPETMPKLFRRTSISFRCMPRAACRSRCSPIHPG